MRVLLATPYLHPEGGGLERYADALAVHLARAGHDVTQLGYAESAREEFVSGFRRVGVPFSRRISNTPVGLPMLRALRERLRVERFDVVNGHTPVPGVAEFAAYAAWRERVPFVVTYHAGRLSGGSAGLSAVAWLHRSSLERFVLSRASGRIAVSPYVGENALRGWPATVVAPGVDTAQFFGRVPPLSGRILFVGPVSRAYAWKGFETLFEAFCRLASGLPRAHLRVVGAGDLVQRYGERARDAGLAGRLTFAGRLSDEALVREYSLANVVVLASHTDAESFGMVLAEANACGRPVIGSRVGGIPSFVSDGENGLLVEPRDVDGLRNALEHVLLRPDVARAMGERGANRVRSHHEWPALTEKTVKVYEEAIAHHRRAQQDAPVVLERASRF